MLGNSNFRECTVNDFC